MSKAKNITTIVLQLVVTFCLIGVKGWGIDSKSKYSPNSFRGYDESIFEAIKNYNSLRDYGISVKSSVDYPRYPSVLVYLLFILMAVIIVYSVVKLSNKEIGLLNKKVMCTVSIVALLITMYLMLFPFGGKTLKFYLMHNNPGVKFIILASMIATALLIIHGEKTTSTEAASSGVGEINLNSILPKKHNQTASASTTSQPLNTEQPKATNDNKDWANTLIQYKALLDEGVITQEEFNKKKSELMK